MLRQAHGQHIVHQWSDRRHHDLALLVSTGEQRRASVLTCTEYTRTPDISPITSLVRPPTATLTLVLLCLIPSDLMDEDEDARSASSSLHSDPHS